MIDARIVDANGNILDRATMGEGYILGGENATLERFYEILSELANLPLVRRIESQWKSEFRLAARNLFRALSGQSPAGAPEEVEMLKMDWACSSAKAQRELGYGITPLRDGLAPTVQWIREKYLSA